jgi:hypothetical protein
MVYGRESVMYALQPTEPVAVTIDTLCDLSPWLRALLDEARGDRENHRDWRAYELYKVRLSFLAGEHSNSPYPLLHTREAWDVAVMALTDVLEV